MRFAGSSIYYKERDDFSCSYFVERAESSSHCGRPTKLLPISSIVEPSSLVQIRVDTASAGW
jgi:hypothetical protein